VDAVNSKRHVLGQSNIGIAEIKLEALAINKLHLPKVSE